MADAAVATTHGKDEAPSPARAPGAADSAAPEVAAESGAQALVRAHLAAGAGAAGGSGGGSGPPASGGWSPRVSRVAARDVVALQRMAGNRAVAGMLARRGEARAPSVQRGATTAVQRAAAPSAPSRPTLRRATVQREPTAADPAPLPTTPKDDRSAAQARKAWEDKHLALYMRAAQIDTAAAYLGRLTSTMKNRDGTPADVLIYGLETTFMVVYNRDGIPISERLPLELPKGTAFDPGVYVTNGGVSRRVRYDVDNNQFRQYEMSGLLVEPSKPKTGPAPGAPGAPGTPATNGASPTPTGTPAPAGAAAPTGKEAEGEAIGEGPGSGAGASTGPNILDIRKYLKDQSKLEAAFAPYRGRKVTEFFLVKSSPITGGGTGKGTGKTSGFGGEIEGKGEPANMPPWPVSVDGPKMLPVGGAGTFVASINWAANGSNMIDRTTAQMGTSIHYRWEIFDVTAFAKAEAKKAEERAKQAQVMVRELTKQGKLPESDPKSKEAVAARAELKPAGTTGVGGAGGGASAVSAGGKSEPSLADKQAELTRSKAGTGTAVDPMGGANAEYRREFRNLWDDTGRAWNNVGESKAGSWAERRSDDWANLTAVGLLPVSALVTKVGATLRWYTEVFAGEKEQQEIPVPREGTFLVRVITTPRVDSDRDGNPLIRPSSVASHVVEVQKMERLIGEGLDEPAARVAEMEAELARLLKADRQDTDRINELTRQIEMAKLETIGDPHELLTKKIALKEKELAEVKAKYEGKGVRGPIIQVSDELEVLTDRLRILELQEKSRNATGMLAPARRVNATLVSEVTGGSYPLLLQVGPSVAGTGGKPHRWKVLDATSKKSEGFEGVGNTPSEAMTNAFEALGKDAAYGRGIIGIRLGQDVIAMLENGYTQTELRIVSQPVGWAIARTRIDDLVMTLVALGLLVASAGTAAAVIGAAVAAAKLIHRLRNGTLYMDAETVSDVLAVLGAAGIAAQAATGMAIKQLGKAFVMLPEEAATALGQAKLAKAAAAIEKAASIAKGVEIANEVLNYGGVIWGNVTFLGQMIEIAEQEAKGDITHAEARRQRAMALGGAIQNNGLFLAGNVQKAREAAKKANAPRGTAGDGPPAPGHDAGPSKANASESVAPAEPRGGTTLAGEPPRPAAPRESSPPADPTKVNEAPAAPKSGAEPGPTSRRTGEPTEAPVPVAEPAKPGSEPHAGRPAAGAGDAAGPAGAGPGAGAGAAKDGPAGKAGEPAQPKPGSGKAKAKAKQHLDDIAAGNSADSKASAEDAIKLQGDWKEGLKDTLAGMEGAERAAAEKALVEARDNIVNSEWKKIQESPKYAGPDGKPLLFLENTGTKSFGSDVDATVRPTAKEGGNVPEQIKLAAEAAAELSQALRDRIGGGETDKVIDTNIYSFIGEGAVRPTDPKAKAAVQHVDIVAGLAEQLRGQGEQQFKAFQNRLGKALGTKATGLEAKALLAEARSFHEARTKEFGDAMAEQAGKHKDPAAQKRAARDQILARKKGELADLIGAKEQDHAAIARKQAEINWFAPDAYATPSAFKQAVAHGQRLKGQGKAAREMSGPEVATKLREEAGRRAPDDPHAQRLRQTADLVESQGRLLEVTNGELKQAQKETPMDARRVQDLTERAARLRESIASTAERQLVAEIYGETGPGNRPSAERLAEAAAASAANLGMQADHVAHAKNINDKVKAAAKYAGRIAMAEFLGGMRPSSDPVARLIADFVKGRWGIMEDASSQIMRDMFVRYARAKGRHTELTYRDGRPVGASDALKQAFVDDVQAWGRDANDRLQAAAIGAKAFDNPSPTTPSRPGDGEAAPKPPAGGPESVPGAARATTEAGEPGPRAGADEGATGRSATTDEGQAPTRETPRPSAPEVIIRTGGVTDIAQSPVLPPGEHKLFEFRIESLREANEVIRRIAAGDAAALAEKGVQLPPGYRTQGREFGLVALPDGTYAIVQGGDGEVFWYNAPPGSVPLAHTHPMSKARQLHQPRTVADLAANAQGSDVAKREDAVFAFPSGADAVFCVANRLPTHDVHSPYVHSGDGVLKTPTGAPGEKQVSFRMSDIRHGGNIGMFPVAEVILTAHDADGATLWTGRMYAANLGGASTWSPTPFAEMGPPRPDTLPFALKWRKAAPPPAGGSGGTPTGAGSQAAGNLGAGAAGGLRPGTLTAGAGRSGAGDPGRSVSQHGNLIEVDGVDGGAWLKDDGYTLTIRGNADPTASVQLEGRGSSLHLTSVDRRELDPVTGPLLLAEALRHRHVDAGTEIVVQWVVNKETLEVHKAGKEPAESRLGKAIERALVIRGLSVRRMAWETVGGRLSIVVVVG